MIFHGINYLAVVFAALAGMAAGGVWYTALAKHWLKAVGFESEPKPTFKVYGFALLSQVVIAYILAGLIGHIGTFTIGGGILSALFCWAGFTLAPMITNHRFQGSGWNLTLIDGGYWLVVFALQGAIIGWMGV